VPGRHILGQIPQVVTSHQVKNPLPLRGSGGVVPAKPGPGTRFRGGWTPRGHPPKGRVRRLVRRCWLCPLHPPDHPSPRGGKGSLARAVIPSRATKTRLSKPSLQHGQHQLFTGPASPSRNHETRLGPISVSARPDSRSTRASATGSIDRRAHTLFPVRPDSAARKWLGPEKVAKSRSYSG